MIFIRCRNGYNLVNMTAPPFLHDAPLPWSTITASVRAQHNRELRAGPTPHNRKPHAAQAKRERSHRKARRLWRRFMAETIAELVE